MERCWCEEERAPYSTKGEKVSPLTEAQCARRRLGSSKREPVRMADPSRSGRRGHQIPADAKNNEHRIAGLPRK